MSEEVVNEEVVETPVEETPVENTEEVAFANSFIEQIDDPEVREAGFWKNLEGKNATEVGRYFKELQSFAGKKGDIPKPDASEEEWSEFYSKLGRPESAEGYDFTLNEEFTEIVGEDAAPFFEKAIEGFKEHAFSMGANADKAEELVDWYLGMVAEQVEEGGQAEAKANEENETALRKEWGDSYDGLNRSIRSMLEVNGMNKEDVEALDTYGVLNEPSLAIALGNIAKRFSDDPEIGHLQTQTQAGVRDQLYDVEQEVVEFVKRGERIPVNLQEKRSSLMSKLGENL